MPHLPPIDVSDGGSVTINVPFEEVDEYGNQIDRLFEEVPCKDKPPAYRKGDDNRFLPEPDDTVISSVMKSNRDDVKWFNGKSYVTADPKAKIYLVEIHCNGEILEFRPNEGKCKVQIYYALGSELPVSRKDKWEENAGQKEAC